MFTPARRRSPAATVLRGISLIELLVGIVILALALAMGAPSFSEWLTNSQIRSTAESLQNGLHFARAEAVRRNAVVRLQLTTTLDDTCTLSKTGTSWVVSLASAGTPASHCTDAVAETGSSILQKGNPVSANAKATIKASQAAFGFNGLGRIVKTSSPDTEVEDSSIDIQSSSGACAADTGGTLRCLRVLVTAGGQIRMCDPKRGSGDPMACSP